MTKLKVEPINLTAPLMPDDPKKSLEALQSEASIQLKKILAQGKSIEKFQSNVDLLMKRYHVSESYFDQAASWYGDLNWWIKLSLIPLCQRQ